jgi:hypothetical protein
MKRSEIFPVLDPPPFGLTRMKSKMAQTKPHFRLRTASLATMAAALTVTAWALSKPPDFREALRTLPSGALLGLNDFAAGVVPDSTSKAALLRVESVNPQVLFYRMETMESPGVETDPK